MVCCGEMAETLCLTPLPHRGYFCLLFLCPMFLADG